MRLESWICNHTVSEEDVVQILQEIINTYGLSHGIGGPIFLSSLSKRDLSIQKYIHQNV